MGQTALFSPPKEVVLRIFIALKNPSSLAGSNGKQDNHYTTDGDVLNG
jgi:hypothetical protein